MNFPLSTSKKRQNPSAPAPGSTGSSCVVPYVPWIRSPLTSGEPGVLHGARSYLLTDDHGQIRETHSISAGLDYPGVGPEHSYYKDTERASYVAVTDNQALEGFRLLCHTEGIVPALEPAHAIYHAARLATDLPADRLIVVNLSGRGDKDLETVIKEAGMKL